MKEPLISVIIPSYNRASILKKAVTSVLNQTYKNIEVILVDDCSTDNTQKVAEEILDSRFRYIKLNKNVGACAARNKGIQEAKGSFIAFNDSDDQWYNEKLEKQYNFLLKNNADIVTCAMNVYDENNSLMYRFPDESKIKEGEISQKSLLNYNVTSTQLLFGKAECFKNELFDITMPRFQDWEACLRLSNKFKLIFQDKTLVNTYQQKDSITKNPQRGLSGMEKLLEKYQEEIFSNPSITESFLKKMASFRCLCGQNPIKEMALIVKSKPSLNNKLRLLLAKTGLYRLLYALKN